MSAPTPEERQQWREEAARNHRRVESGRILALMDALDAEEAERQRCHKQEMRLLIRLEAAAAELADVRSDLDRVRPSVDHLARLAEQLREQGDVRQVMLTDEGVDEAPTLADELWLIAYNLRAALEDQ